MEDEHAADPAYVSRWNKSIKGDSTHMFDRVLNVYERLSMKEDVEKLNELLLYVHLYPHISTKRLAMALQLPKPLTIAMKREFIQAGFIIQERGVVLSAEGRHYAEKFLGFAGVNNAAYRQLLESENGNCPVLHQCMQKYAEVFAGRPQADVTLDQAKATMMTSFKRAWLCLKHHTLLGKQILCIGDDDLVSVAIGLLHNELAGQKGSFAPTVAVVEKDERIIRYIRSLTEKHSLQIRCIEHDLREPLPTLVKGKYDVLFTDPPYTYEGMCLFLSRGLEGLKTQSGLPIFLSFGSKPAEETFRIQQKWNEVNLVIERMIPGFNQYEGAQSLNSQGQMIILRTMAGFHPDVPGYYAGALYTMDGRKHQDKTYICLHCGDSIKLTLESGCQTIEQLKEAGCPSCGHKYFTQMQKRRDAHERAE